MNIKPLRFKHLNSEIVLGQPIYNEPYAIHMSESLINSNKNIVNMPLHSECSTQPIPNMFADKEIMAKHDLGIVDTSKFFALNIYENEEIEKANKKLKELEAQGIDTSPVLQDVPNYVPSLKPIKINNTIAPIPESDSMLVSNNGTPSSNVNPLTSFTINLVTYKYTPMDSDDIENRGKYFAESKTVTFSSNEDFFYKTGNEISVLNGNNNAMSRLVTQKEFEEQEKINLKNFISNTPGKIELLGNNDLPIGNEENILPGLVRPPSINKLPIIGTVSTPLSSGKVRIEWLK